MSRANSILAIIPARGGSKGIPGKNLYPVAGKPLIAHTIKHALEARSVDRVVVSTDDSEIGEVAEQYGAEVVWRPAEISGDLASSESALLHVHDRFMQRENVEPEVLVFLQATSPIRSSVDIDEAVKQFLDEELDSLFSASPAHGFVWELRGESLQPLTYDYRRRPMRQEIGERLMENGSFYVLRPKILVDGGNRLGGRIGIFRMGFIESLQVDGPEDIELIEWILECRRRFGEPSHDRSKGAKACRAK